MSICCNVCKSPDVQMIKIIIDQGTVVTQATHEGTAYYNNGTFWGGRASTETTTSSTSQSVLATELSREFSTPPPSPVKPEEPGPSGVVIWLMLIISAAVGYFIGNDWIGIVSGIVAYISLFIIQDKLFPLKKAKKEEYRKKLLKYENEILKNAELDKKRIQMKNEGYFCHKCGNRFLNQDSSNNQLAEAKDTARLKITINKIADILKKETKGIEISPEIQKVPVLTLMNKYEINENFDDILVYVPKSPIESWMLFTNNKLATIAFYDELFVIPYSKIESLEFTPPTSGALGKPGQLFVNDKRVRTFDDIEDGQALVDLFKELASIFKHS